MPDHPPVRIYYLASGHLGIPILDQLRQDPRLTLVGIGSQPDQLAGRRKQKCLATPLATYGDKLGLTIDRVASVNTAEFHDRMRQLQIDLLVVASFGQILRPALLELPPLGCLNVHASLLPRFRGASPINMAILHGDKNIGVTFMKMDAGLDTGDIYYKVGMPIAKNDTTETLEEKLGKLAAKKIGDVIWRIARHELQALPQPEKGVCLARKIKKEAGAISWGNSAQMIERMVRAYTPWPRACALMPVARGCLKQVQFTEVKALSINASQDAVPGEVMAAGKDGLLIACGEGILLVTKLILEGKEEMVVADFLRGYALQPGAVLKDYPLGEK